MRRILLAFGFVVATVPLHAVAIKAPAAPMVCPFTGKVTQKVDHQVLSAIHDKLVRTFDAALGPLAKDVGTRKGAAKAAASRVDSARMAALAEASGCAALIDERSGCAQYFDTELGDPLSVITSMPKDAPLRVQYEQALAQLGNAEFKRAAQGCMKLVGRR